MQLASWTVEEVATTVKSIHPGKTFFAFVHGQLKITEA